MKKDLIVLNPRSNVAICSLWTRKEVILEQLTAVREKVWGVGTLYTVYGINYLLHTLDNEPHVDTIILFGADLSGSGEALIDLFNNANPPPSLLWSLDEIRHIIESVRLVDLRKAFQKGDVSALIAEVERNYHPRGPVRRKGNLVLEETPVTSWPIPIAGFLIYDNSLFRAWIKLLNLVMKYGYLKDSEYGEAQKEILGVVACIGLYGHTYELEREFLRYFKRSLFKSHLESTIMNYKPTGVAYSYGERLRAHPIAGDQLSHMLLKLRKVPYTRRAVAVLWHPEIDPRSNNPPCIVAIQGIVSGEYYNHFVILRSSDCYGGWPLNAYAQIKLSESIAKELGLKQGVVSLMAVSAHVYEHDWLRVKRVLTEASREIGAFVEDPRGYLLFESSKLVQRTPVGQLVNSLTLTGLESEIYNRVKPLAMELLPEHAFWLGFELAKRFVHRSNTRSQE